MNLPVEKVAPKLMQTGVDALRDLCGVQLVIGVQVLFADGQLHITAHNLDKDGLLALLEGVMANIRSGQHLRQHAVDGQIVATESGRPN